MNELELQPPSTVMGWNWKLLKDLYDIYIEMKELYGAATTFTEQELLKEKIKEILSIKENTGKRVEHRQNHGEAHNEQSQS